MKGKGKNFLSIFYCLTAHYFVNKVQPFKSHLQNPKYSLLRRINISLNESINSTLPLGRRLLAFSSVGVDILGKIKTKNRFPVNRAENVNRKC